MQPEHSAPPWPATVRAHVARVDTDAHTRSVGTPAAGTAAGRRGAGDGGAGSGARRAPLGSTANRFSAVGAAVPRDERRRQRLRARQALHSLSGLERVQDCGRTAVLPGGQVIVRRTGHGADAVAGLAGLSTCGSVWACPVCSARIAGERQRDVGEALAAWQRGRDGRAGGAVGMVTLTMRHHAGQALSDLWDALSKAWNAVTAGSGWLADQRRYGVGGWLRVVEVTHGENGWHVHVHALVFLDADHGTNDRVEALGRRMFGRWRASLVRERTTRDGRTLRFDAPLADQGGLDARLMLDTAGVGAYLVGKTLFGSEAVSRGALEVTRGDLKAGRGGNRTPWQVLADFLDTGDMADLDLWHAWESGSKGRRQMTWSKGLRDELRLSAERTDEEIVAEDMGGDDLVVLDADAWRAIRDDAALLADMLDAAETAGAEGVVHVLAQAGVVDGVTIPPPRAVNAA